jgi:uracil-DNA glycosylase
MKMRGIVIRPRPQFGHGAIHALPAGPTLIGCYHPSRQNTNTGKLTSPMMDAVFQTARRLLER